ncbi:MAG TPA: hypothetical protein VIW80_14140 [Pyrinomonadaceae bacterium]
MDKMLLIALLTASVLCSLPPCGSSAWQEKTGAIPAPVSESSIKVTIATGGGLYGPVKSRFKVGEEIPVVISMTNKGDKTAKYCLSTSLFQNRPQLRRDSQLIPYLTNMTREADKEDAIQRCERSAARRFQELQPNQARVVDWFNISQMGIAWYPPLPVGHYELVLMRRIDCCQGPLVESNKVTFEIIP